MNLWAFFFLLGSLLLPLLDQVFSAPLSNEGKCSQQMMVGGEKMWVTDVLANHNCPMEPLFSTVMGRSTATNMFAKMLGSSPETYSVCSGLIGILDEGEGKHSMDMMCSSLAKDWEWVFCTEYYDNGKSVADLKHVVSYRQSDSLPPEISLAIDSLASLDQKSCYRVCGGGKGFICKAFMRLLMALLSLLPLPEGRDSDVQGQPLKVNGGPDTAADTPQKTGNASGNKSVSLQKVPTRYGQGAVDGSQSGPKGQDGFSFVPTNKQQPNQPGFPQDGFDPVANNRPNSFPGNVRQPNSSQLSKFFGSKARPPFSKGLPQTGLGQTQTGLGQPQTGLGQPQTGLGQPQAGLGQPQTGLGQPQAGLGQPQAGLGQPQTGLGQPQTGIGQTQTGLGQPQTGLGQPQAGLGQPQTGLGQPQTGLGQPQTGLGQPHTSTRQPQTGIRQPLPGADQSLGSNGQPQTNARQPQTNARQPQTGVNHPQDKSPNLGAGTRTGPPKKNPDVDGVLEDLLAIKEEVDEDKDGAKPGLDESDEEDDEEHEMFEKTHDGDEEDELEKDEELSRSQFKVRPPEPPKPKLAMPQDRNQGPPQPPPVLDQPPAGIPPNRPARPTRPPSLKGRPFHPAPVNIKSADSVVSEEEEYHGHSPVFFLTILCIMVLSGAMCYFCIANKIRVRETLHILLTSKGSKSRREYR